MYLHPPSTDYNYETQEAGTHSGLPCEFGPTSSPILTEHWFNWRPIGEIAAEVVMRLRPRREMPNRPSLTHEVPKLID